MRRTHKSLDPENFSNREFPIDIKNSDDQKQIQKLKQILKNPEDAQEWISQVSEHQKKKLFNLIADEIILFPGTFNPWHQGHQTLFNRSSQQAPCFVIPDSNPQKKNLDSNLHDGTDQSRRLLELFQKIAPTWIVPEFLLPKYSQSSTGNPTSRWFPEWQKQSKSVLALAMGADQFLNLQTWLNVSDLLKSVSSLKVLDRNGANPNNAFKSSNERYQIQENWIHSEIGNVKIDYLGTHEFEELSSSSIRAQDRSADE